MWPGNCLLALPTQRRSLLAENLQLQSHFILHFDSTAAQRRYEELSRRLMTAEPIAEPAGCAILLMPDDVVRLLCKFLGAPRFLYASCCRQWLDTASTMHPDDDLWQEACMAESPLLARMHTLELAWKQLLKQRRLADRTPARNLLGPNAIPSTAWTSSISPWVRKDYGEHVSDLSFELIDSATNTVVRHGWTRLKPEAFIPRTNVPAGERDGTFWDIPVHEFEIEPPLKLAIDRRPDCVDACSLRLSLYLTTGARMYCLVREEQHGFDERAFQEERAELEAETGEVLAPGEIPTRNQYPSGEEIFPLERLKDVFDAYYEFECGPMCFTAALRFKKEHVHDPEEDVVDDEYADHLYGLRVETDSLLPATLNHVIGSLYPSHDSSQPWTQHQHWARL